MWCVQVRCIITGPQDTPYECGMFVFDVFFPEGYPNVPPLMVLETTGDGRARFNPNLYAGEDGGLEVKLNLCVSAFGDLYFVAATSRMCVRADGRAGLLLQGTHVSGVTCVQPGPL